MAAATDARVNRLSARQLTAVLHLCVGATYHAAAHRGGRYICRVDGLAVDRAPHAATWAEALRAARVHFGWTADLTATIGGAR